MAVSSKLHLIVDNHIDDFTLASTPTAVSTLPLTNLQIQSRGRIARFTGTSAVITGSLATSQFASGFAITRHNLTSTATVRLRLYAGETQTGTVNYDSTATSVSTPIPWGSFYWGVSAWGATYEDDSGLPNIFNLWFDSVTYKSFQIDISAPDNSVIDAARIFLGQAFEPNYNISYGSRLTWVDPSKHLRTAGGSLRTESAIPFRRFEFELGHLSDAERELLSGLLESGGKASDILLTKNPNATGRTRLEQTMVCKRITDNAMAHANYNRNISRLQFDEV